MNTNLLRNSMLFLSVLLLLCIGALAYGSYRSAADFDTADACKKMNNHNTEMPWESLAHQLLGAVRL